MFVPDSGYMQVLGVTHPLFEVFREGQAQRDNDISEKVRVYHEESKRFIETAHLVNHLQKVTLYVYEAEQFCYPFDEYNRETYVETRLFEHKVTIEDYLPDWSRNIVVKTGTFFKNNDNEYFKVVTSNQGFILEKVFLTRLKSTK
ncbi:MAG: hypothetical protein LLF94_04070 [Chlamydiales bacterium]|nr:hypothetical protein [Chlamydiales bacterium]